MKCFKCLKISPFLIKNAASILYFYFFPERCISCCKEINRKSPFSICSRCLAKIPQPYHGFSSSNRCSKCGKNLISENNLCTSCRTRQYLFVTNNSLWNYSDDNIRIIIHNYKFKKYRQASLFFSEQISVFYNTHYRGFAIVPVPCSRKRINNNGWDHMKIISDILLSKNIPVFNILKRKSGIEQKKLSSDNRIDNIKNRFYLIKYSSVKMKSFKGILIIDDIFTTGSTVNECTRVLRQTGNNNIHILTLAID